MERTAEQQGRILAENLYEIVEKERNELYVRHSECETIFGFRGHCSNNTELSSEHTRLRGLGKLAVELSEYIVDAGSYTTRWANYQRSLGRNVDQMIEGSHS